MGGERRERRGIYDVSKDGRGSESTDGPTPQRNPSGEKNKSQMPVPRGLGNGEGGEGEGGVGGVQGGLYDPHARCQG